MKRTPRSSSVLGAIDLADALATQMNMRLDELGAKFSFRDSIQSATKNPLLMHGRRAENMFEYVIASLGKAALIKKEDAGTITSTDGEVKAPDYFVSLIDGRKFLIEVKNCRLKNFRTQVVLNSAYLQCLERYAELTGHPLLIAVYWSNMRQWTINQPKDVVGPNDSITLTFIEAMKFNMASAFGDRMLMTVPPLICRLWTDSEKPRSIDSEGIAQFTVKNITFYASGVEISDEIERNLAFYFMFHSRWVERRCEAVLTDTGEINYIEFESAPEDGMETEGQPMQSLGTLAEMISNYYNWMTLSKNNEIVRLTPAQQPGEMGCSLPDDFKGKVLRLWILKLQPHRTNAATPQETKKHGYARTT